MKKSLIVSLLLISCATRNFSNSESAAKSWPKKGYLNVWYECPAKAEADNGIFFMLIPNVNSVINAFSPGKMLGDLSERLENKPSDLKSQKNKEGAAGDGQESCGEPVGGVMTPLFKVKLAGKAYRANSEYNTETFYNANHAYVFPDSKVYLMLTSSVADSIEIKRLEVEYEGTFLETLVENDKEESKRRQIEPTSKAEFSKILKDWAKVNARRPVTYYPIGERKSDGTLELDSTLKFHLRAERKEQATTVYPDIVERELILEPQEFEAKAKSLESMLNLWSITNRTALSKVTPVQAAGVRLDYIYKMLYGPDFGKNLPEWNQRRNFHAVVLDKDQKPVFATIKNDEFVKRNNLGFESISSVSLFLPKYAFGEKLPDYGLWLKINDATLVSSYQLFSSGFGLGPKSASDENNTEDLQRSTKLFDQFQKLYFGSL